METPNPLTMPLGSGEAPLVKFGGKGRSLAKLVAAGFPVPDGFLISTHAYTRFVDTNDLRESIHRIVDAACYDSGSVEEAAARIKSMFAAGQIPEDVIRPIAQAYATLGEDSPAVAVRSSATAEDLANVSFAGQQETFLNVRGEAEVISAVLRCWASLWTARAIDYRLRMDIDQRAIAMAVVVQLMVPAEVSGILFTANPTTGERAELVVNASYGLGEAVVGGRVTPDTYVLDRDHLEIKESTIAEKNQMILPADEQGTVTQPVPSDVRNEPSLLRPILRELAEHSIEAAKLFQNCPQDIEWAVGGGKVWLLQSRPITHLPPPPLHDVKWEPPSPGMKLIRRQVVENMPEPLSPLFDELYLEVGLDRAVDEFLSEFGWKFDVELFVERPFFLTVNGYAYCRGSYRSSWRLLWHIPSILYAYVRIVPGLLMNARNKWSEEALPAHLDTIDRWKNVDSGLASHEKLIDGLRELTTAEAIHWFNVTMMVAMAKVTDGLLHRYLQSWCVPGNLTSGMFLCGFPSQTIDAQAELESIANQIRRDAELRKLIVAIPVDQLVETLSRADDSISADLLTYLDRYGHQVFNLDFVEPTLCDDPSPLLSSLRSLVASEGFDTPARQAALSQKREELIQETLSSLGPIRRWVFRKLLGWAQSYGPCREEALFYMGAAWPTLRRLALELGQRLVARGTLSRSDDVFFLTSSELADCCPADFDGKCDFGSIATERRELRESRKRLHAPSIIPEGSRWKLGPFDMTAFETQKRNAKDADMLEGFPVSPGTVTAVATVVLSPADFGQMQPGSILVCPTTTPAWTPLFTQAAGLVTDIGGILAHGSIIAREYGIPAVMGTGNGTQRIVTGQTITVDGDSGTVTIE